MYSIKYKLTQYFSNEENAEKLVKNLQDEEVKAFNAGELEITKNAEGEAQVFDAETGELAPISVDEGEVKVGEITNYASDPYAHMRIENIRAPYHDYHSNKDAYDDPYEKAKSEDKPNYDAYSVRGPYYRQFSDFKITDELAKDYLRMRDQISNDKELAEYFKISSKELDQLADYATNNASKLITPDPKRSAKVFSAINDLQAKYQPSDKGYVIVKSKKDFVALLAGETEGRDYDNTAKEVDKFIEKNKIKDPVFIGLSDEVDFEIKDKKYKFDEYHIICDKSDKDSILKSNKSPYSTKLYSSLLFSNDPYNGLPVSEGPGAKSNVPSITRIKSIIRELKDENISITPESVAKKGQYAMSDELKKRFDQVKNEGYFSSLLFSNESEFLVVYKDSTKKWQKQLFKGSSIQELVKTPGLKDVEILAILGHDTHKLLSKEEMNFSDTEDKPEEPEVVNHSEEGNEIETEVKLYSSLLFSSPSISELKGKTVKIGPDKGVVKSISTEGDDTVITFENGDITKMNTKKLEDELTEGKAVKVFDGDETKEDKPEEAPVENVYQSPLEIAQEAKPDDNKTLIDLAKEQNDKLRIK